MEKHPIFEPLISEQAVRSDTVIAVTADAKHLANLKEEAKKAGFLLGNGYDKWKESTFRIANFPAISTENIYKLKEFLHQYEVNFS